MYGVENRNRVYEYFRSWKSRRRPQGHDLQKDIVLGKWHPKIEGHTRGRRQEECDKVLRVEDSLDHALACDFCVAVMGTSFRAACCCCFLQFMKCLSFHNSIFRAELTT